MPPPTPPVTTPPTLDPVLPRYETSDPTECPRRDYGGPSGEGMAGQRNDVSLKAAFKNSPIYRQTATPFYNEAKNKFSTYNGENVSSGLRMYRRDFQPNPEGGVEYRAVRDKTTTQIGATGLPATPFSPNIASPNVPEGTLFIGASQITDVVSGIGATVLTTKLAELNPTNTIFQNLDSIQHSNDIGGVRRFVLGIGSGMGRLRIPRTV